MTLELSLHTRGNAMHSGAINMLGIDSCKKGPVPWPGGASVQGPQVLLPADLKLLFGLQLGERICIGLVLVLPVDVSLRIEAPAQFFVWGKSRVWRHAVQ